MENNEKPKSKVGTIIGIVFIFFVLLYVAISYPSMVAYRPLTFCSRVEYDAHQIEYQNSYPEWDSHIYTKKIEW